MTDHGQQDIGTMLRAARERAGRSLRQIADTTKLSVHILAALEQNRISQLPGGIYRRSIVRGYAQEVGLDPEETLRRFLALYPDEVPSAVIAKPAPPPGRSQRALQMVASLLGAAVPIAAGIYYFASLSAPPPSRAHSSTLARRAADAPKDAPRPEPDAAKVLRPESDGRISMTVSVSSGTRLQVVADGQEVLARRVDAGEEVHLAFTTDAVLVGDDAGAVHLSFDGQDGRSLGEAGSALRIRIPRNGYQSFLRQP